MDNVCASQGNIFRLRNRVLVGSSPSPVPNVVARFQGPITDSTRKTRYALEEETAAVHYNFTITTQQPF